jgi:uncharacterized protein YhjY with autotransporter beta-barrel domain
MSMRRWMVFVLAAWVGAAGAQSPDTALAASWNTLCAGAPTGSALATRCAEIFSGGPNSRQRAAGGNFLGEIPGQGRAATRDGAPDDDPLRTDLGAGWALFASADTGRLERRDGTNEAPFDGDTGSISAGVDWTPAANWQLGLLANHTRDELDFVFSRGSLRTTFTGAMAVAGWNISDTVALDGYAGALRGDYRVRRAINYTLLSGVAVDALADASIDADRSLAGLGVTWAIPSGGWEWQLGAGLDWQRTDLDAYAETGASGLALSVPARSITSRRGRLDAALARNISASWGVWQPMLRLGWRREFANPARPLTVRFVNDGQGTPISFDTDDADNAWGEAGVGAVFVFTGGHSAFIEFRQRFGHDFLQERLLSVGWRMELP